MRSNLPTAGFSGLGEAQELSPPAAAKDQPLQPTPAEHSAALGATTPLKIEPKTAPVLANPPKRDPPLRRAITSTKDVTTREWWPSTFHDHVNVNGNS